MSNYEETYIRKEHHGAGGEPLGQKIQRKAGEAWQDVKEATPGTTEYRATHPDAAAGAAHGTGQMYSTTGAHGTGQMYGGADAQNPTGSYNTGTYNTSGAGITGSGEPLGQHLQRKAGEAWEGVKEATPGTREHAATHPTAGMGSGATHTGMYDAAGAYSGFGASGTGAGYTGAGTGTTGAYDAVSGTTDKEPLGQKIQRKAGEAFETIKEKLPGTAEHKATHGTGAPGTGGIAPSGHGTTTEYQHFERRNL